MIVFLIVNNILVIFGIKCSYSEDDQDGTGEGGGGVIPFWLFFFFDFYLFWVKKFEKTKEHI